MFLSVKYTMFRVTGNKGTTWYFDHITNSFYDHHSNPINLLHLIDTESLILPSSFRHNEGWLYKTDALMTLSDKWYPSQNMPIKAITIQMGTKCNYNCLYCSQAYNPDDSINRVNIDNFCESLLNSGIDFSQVQNIALWGGEPLVYWKYVKQLVEFIETYIPEYKYGCHITTNCSLLDKEKTDFLIEHNVRGQVSHDGISHTQTRCNDDWLRNDLLRSCVQDWIGNHCRGSVSLTWSPPFGASVFDSLDLFEEYLPNVPVCARAPLRCDSSNSWILSLYSKKQVSLAKEQAYQLFTLPISHKHFERTYPTRSLLVGYMQAMAFGKSVESIRYSCPSKKLSHVGFNLKGEYVACHNVVRESGVSYGTIDDLSSCYEYGNTSSYNRNRCRHCHLIHFCNQCGYHDDYNNYLHCKSTKWFHEAVFEAAWFHFFKERPIKVEQC